ncbi:cysteine-rich receptor-like protein kinase [Tanacetum coccineum]
MIEPNDIKRVFFDHFSCQFSEPSYNRVEFFSSKFKRLSVDQCLVIERPFCDEEIKTTFLECGEDKAPGLDGADPTKPKEYCLISLIGCQYKITDGPLIVNELISWSKKHKSKLMIFKQNWIKGCFNSTFASILINGSPSKDFSLSRGLRQGDPLSPFLFLVAAEDLHVFMEEAIEKKHFIGIHAAQNYNIISHLQFANDVLFVGVKTATLFPIFSLQHYFSRERLEASVPHDHVNTLAHEVRCKGPKLNGGLGIGNLKAANLALLSHWWWRIRSDKSALWNSVILGWKYTIWDFIYLKLSVIRCKKVLLIELYGFLALWMHVIFLVLELDPNLSVNSANLNPNLVSISVDDPLYIGNSDHPRMVLTNIPFNGSNFLGWSRTVKMALGAKLKLGFINETCARLVSEGENLQRWIRCDYMVTCWILNLTTTKLSKAFLYAQFAFELWKEIVKRYGQREQSNPGLDHKLVVAVCQEVMKMFNEKNPMPNIGGASSFMHHAGSIQLTPSLLLDLSTKEVVAIGKGSRCLYTCTSLDPSTSSTSQKPTINSINVFDFHNSPVVSNYVHHNVVDLHTIHARLGHLSLSKMIHVDECKKFNTFDFTCDSCSLAKFHRLPFLKNASSSHNSFDLIHADLIHGDSC